MKENGFYEISFFEAANRTIEDSFKYELDEESKTLQNQACDFTEGPLNPSIYLPSQRRSYVAKTRGGHYRDLRDNKWIQDPKEEEDRKGDEELKTYDMILG